METVSPWNSVAISFKTGVLLASFVREEKVWIFAIKNPLPKVAFDGKFKAWSPKSWFERSEWINNWGVLSPAVSSWRSSSDGNFAKLATRLSRSWILSWILAHRALSVDSRSLKTLSIISLCLGVKTTMFDTSSEGSTGVESARKSWTFTEMYSILSCSEFFLST